MTPDERRLIEDLERACDLRSDEAIEAYVAAISALAGGASEDVLRRMLRCLRDTEAGDVQYELVEACEAFPGYVRVFVEEGLELRRVSPRWFRLMFQSILNTPDDVNVAIELINRMSSDARTEYKSAIQGIHLDTPQYSEVLSRIS